MSPEYPDGTALLLEPNENHAAKFCQESIFARGIPATTFEVDDIQKEHERMTALDVNLTMEPTNTVPVMMAIF